MTEPNTKREFHTMAVKGEKEPLLNAIDMGVVDIDSQDTFGYSFLHNAISWRNYDLATELIERGANVNLTNNSRETALTLLARQGDFTLGKLLIDHGADIHATNEKLEDTPLHYTALFGNAELMAYLVSQGADVNQQSSSGHTPLHTVLNIRGKSEDLLELTMILTEQPINPTLKAFDGRTVLDMAAELPEEVQKLVQEGVAKFKTLANQERGQKMFKSPNAKGRVGLKRRR